MNILVQMLSKYDIKSEDEYINALKEIYQEITLLGLYRGGFFQKAAFYGGTALRILHGLNRFSEDLDFSLLKKDTSFNMEDYFPYIIDEFEALDIKMTLTKKQKSKNSNIESAFLKNDTSIHTLNIDTNNPALADITKGVHSGRKIKIKLEIDVNPPLKFQTEARTLLLPTTFNIISMTLPSLYAGKLHALLFRNWKTRVKGRDWYDFEWYVKNGVKVDLEHLQERVLKSEEFDGTIPLTKEQLKAMIRRKIETLDIQKAKQEVQVFIKDRSPLEFWSKEYFNFLVDKIEILQ